MKENVAKAGSLPIEAAIRLWRDGVASGRHLAVAGARWSNYQTFRLNQQILSIVENVRNHYEPMGRRGACPANGACPFTCLSNNAIVSSDLIAAA